MHSVINLLLYTAYYFSLPIYTYLIVPTIIINLYHHHGVIQNLSNAFLQSILLYISPLDHVTLLAQYP
jgi:hypothetical protein